MNDYELAEERRRKKEWELNGNCPEEGLLAHAVLKYLVDRGDIEELTDEDKFEIDELNSQLDELELEENNEEEIELIKNQIEEIKNNKIDVYDIYPSRYAYHYMTLFSVLNDDLEGNTYAAGTEYDTDRSATSYVEELIDDVGLKGMNKNTLWSNIDTDEVERYARDLFTDFIYDGPESYIDEDKRQLSESQVEDIKILNRKISKYQSVIDQYNEYIEKYDYDEETQTKIQDKIEDFQELIDSFNDEISEIESDPNGDFPDDEIQDAIDYQVEEAIADPEGFIENYGLELTNFVNVEDIIRDIIESDGYEVMASYDGEVENYRIQNELIYVFRVD
jgi:hypothetical protein